jgi:hypothetical protein
MKNKDIFDKLQEPYGEGCLSYVWACKWAKAFREGRTSLANNARSGRPPIPDGVEHIRAKVECESYQSGSAMAQDIGLSKTHVLEVLKKVLKLRKYVLRWVPHILNDDQKDAGVEMAASMLSILEPLIAHVHSCVLTGMCHGSISHIITKGDGLSPETPQ